MREFFRLPVQGSRRWLLAAFALAIAAASRAAAQEPAKTGNLVYVARPDGSEMKPLAVLDDYTGNGSPVWSQDGKMIAFDSYRPSLGETSNDCKIVVVDADGRNARVLGDGAMPSLSPQRKRIAFSRYSPNYGVWVMSVEGPEKELVLLDEEGWGAEWSPDGKQIVYASYAGTGANFMVYDLVEGVKIPLFEEGALPYSNLYWNFCWSPDGRRIVFKGQRQEGGKNEVAIVDARGAKHGLVTRLKIDVPPNFSWTHDSKSILYALKTPDRGNRSQLYLVDADGDAPPRLLPGQDPERNISVGAFSPDGKKLLMVSRVPPEKPAGNKNPAK